MQFSRRTLLKGAAAGALAGPWFWVKKSFAQNTPGFGSAKHVLILYAGGGLRSVPLFNADVALQHNPFGKATQGAGVEWSPGTLLGTEPIDLFTFNDGSRLRPMPEIAADFAVLAGVDHEPLTDRAVIDHTEGDTRTTGISDEAGLLSIIHKEHPGYRDGSLGLPPFDIGLSTFGRGGGDFSGYRPVAVQSAAEFEGRSQGSSQAERAAWARKLRDRFDDRYVEKRSPHVRPYLAAARDAKQNSKVYAAALRNPALDLLGAPEANLGGVTNTQLLEVLGGGPFAQGQWGLETAFSLRLMQMGVPAVSVLRYLYDTHSDENTQFRNDAQNLGRQLAGIHFLLHRMTESDGTPLWNRTLVFLVSEFGRDNTDPSTGFNSGGGSDHQGSLASRNQVWPVFGGPITAKGKRLGTLDRETLASVDGPARTVRSVQATILSSLGIDASRYIDQAPVRELFV